MVKHRRRKVSNIGGGEARLRILGGGGGEWRSNF